MSQDIEFWQFVGSRLEISDVILLVVADSSGSSPGRAGYKMAVAASGEIAGSIGGGVMEVALVEKARHMLAGTATSEAFTRELVHQKNAPNPSGMICSGRQTVITKRLGTGDAGTVNSIIASLENRALSILTVTAASFSVGHREDLEGPALSFAKCSDTEFQYSEQLGSKPRLYIVGGGHCSLALSEIVAKLGFHITIFDDRPDLNTLEKNEFADEIRIIDGYDRMAEFIPAAGETYVVVMTIGYETDALVIRALAGREFTYFGVLGSKAKMATLLRELKSEGILSDRLDRIRTPVGLPINSRTPEEIAISIAAEIIGVKNSAW